MGKESFPFRDKAVNSVDSNFVDQNYYELIQSEERVKEDYFENTNKRNCRQKINTRPRKCLNFASLAQHFFRCLKLLQGVAFES